jgi:threonine aldolase
LFSIVGCWRHKKWSLPSLATTVRVAITAIFNIMKRHQLLSVILLLTASLPRLIVAGIIQLQNPHEVLTPSQRFQVLSNLCESEGVEGWDVYGDFEKTADDSFLRKFESELATEFGKEDAVFLPSGVMAQSAALLIHKKDGRHQKNSFGCHATSHLLLHEQEGYRELCGLQAVVILPTTTKTPGNDAGIGLGMPPLLYDHLVESNLEDVSTVILELPHRELGGKLTPWEDIEKMSLYLKSAGIAFHCDGARIFEAAAGYQKSVSELAQPFDSVYISFYKGLGGLSGAMLLGSRDFCDQARSWCRRFGGNLYTLLPYIMAAWSGYRSNHVRNNGTNNMSFQEKKDKLMRLADAFASDEYIQQALTLEPSTPQVNMVHCYLRPPVDTCKQVCKDIQDRTDVCLFQRIRPLDKNDPGFDRGYCCKLEISIGEANGRVPDDVWVDAWSEFCRETLKQMD